MEAYVLNRRAHVEWHVYVHSVQLVLLVKHESMAALLDHVRMAVFAYRLKMVAATPVSVHVVTQALIARLKYTFAAKTRV